MYISSPRSSQAANAGRQVCQEDRGIPKSGTGEDTPRKPLDRRRAGREGIQFPQPFVTVNCECLQLSPFWRFNFLHFCLQLFPKSTCKKQQALIEDDPCQGCNGPVDHKPDFCARYCEIILCRKRRENGYQYCDECPDYPCEDVMEKEKRYTSKYPHRESPLENLRMIWEKGWMPFWNRSGSNGPARTVADLFRSMTGISALWEQN